MKNKIIQKISENYDSKITNIIQNSTLRLFDECIHYNDDGSVYIETGDIPAMWLRDSAAQLKPLLHFIDVNNEEEKNLFRGVFKTYQKQIDIDAYANAFVNDVEKNSSHKDEISKKHPYVWERKFELDSICYPIELSYLYYQKTKDESIFNDDYLKMIEKIIETMIIEQNHFEKSDYTFRRVDDWMYFEHEGYFELNSLPNNGRGRKVEYTGMVWSGFRPSDDACKYGYHIPSNMFAVVVLKYLLEIDQHFYNGKNSDKINKLIFDIQTGIETYGKISDPEFGEIYVYETDGRDNYNIMDDANIPSLLSASYIGYSHIDDNTFLNTRRKMLSNDNPYYFDGEVASGIGSPHTQPGNVWPLAIAMEGLSSRDKVLMKKKIELLKNTDADTGYLHESFNVNDASDFTRPWFSWPHSIYLELLMYNLDFELVPNTYVEFDKTNDLSKELLKPLLDIVSDKYSSDSKVYRVFEKCLVNTFETTISIKDDKTYVITGDIPAMWLRDSAAQMRVFLHLVDNDEIKNMLFNMVKVYKEFIIKDPYANAFCTNEDINSHTDDLTDMLEGVWERKYELDSLCFALEFMYLYYYHTGDETIFDDQYNEVIKIVLDLLKLEQDHTNSNYSFKRIADWLVFDKPRVIEFETLRNDGRGNDTGYTGMTWSAFRPSDDACRYNYLLPSNMFMSVVLGYLVEVDNKFNNGQMSSTIIKLRDDIIDGINKYGVYDHPEFGKIWAYEVDGLGNQYLMDDANVPNLLSAPYLGFCDNDDEVYLNTRKFVLSKHNPYYFEGEVSRGLGSPHTPDKYIWHHSIGMEAMTDITTNFDEYIDRYLKSDAGLEMFHEGHHIDNPTYFTRPWFSWSNSIYCEFILETIGKTVRVDKENNE